MRGVLNLIPRKEDVDRMVRFKLPSRDGAQFFVRHNPGMKRCGLGGLGSVTSAMLESLSTAEFTLDGNWRPLPYDPNRDYDTGRRNAHLEATPSGILKGMFSLYSLRAI